MDPFVFRKVHFGKGIAFILFEFGYLHAAEKFKSLVLELVQLTIDEADQELFKRWEARVTTQENSKRRRTLVCELKDVLDKTSGNYNT